MHSADNQDGAPSGTHPQHGGRNSPAGAPTPPSGPGAWTNDGAAADFLGLDQDMTLSGAGSTAADGSPGGGTPVDGSNSWLLSLEGEPEPLAGPTPAPEFAEAFDGTASEAPPADEAAPLAAPRTRRTRAPLLVLAAGVLVAVGGGYAWMQWEGQRARAVPPVAERVPPAGRAPKAAARPTRTAPAPSDTTPAPAPEAAAPVASAPFAAAATDPAAVPPPAAAPSTNGAAFEFGPRSSDERVAGFLAAHAAGSTPDGLAPESGRPALPPIALDVQGFGLPVQQVPASIADATTGARTEVDEPAPDPERRVVHTGRSALRIATDEDLSGVWSGTTVPYDAIDQDARLMTPAIGRVRITIHGGELLEGRLYAVGQRLVWLDTDLGRTAIDSYQVARIDHLSSPDGTPKLGGRGSSELAGLPRMRVRTPGGMLYGKVIGRDERSVTLVTEAGARITIDTTEVEPAPEGRSLIVRGASPRTDP